MIISKKMHARIRIYVQWLQMFADKIWYPPLLSFLAAIDNFIVVVPTDGLLVSSSMLTPRRWFFLAVSVALGSTLGALVLASLVEFHGLPWVLKIYPGVEQSQSWIWSVEFFARFGLLLVFVVAMTPFLQQPVVILASLANTSIWELGGVLLAGRLIKYLVMAFVGSHAPRLLKKMWGLRGELEDSGVPLK